MVRYRPSHESATAAPSSGNIDAAPDHALTAAGARAAAGEAPWRVCRLARYGVRACVLPLQAAARNSAGRSTTGDVAKIEA